ncbi:MAG: CHAP domain-containing protein [Humibacillus sp.]|nr:CHAP domain-containing protein [Humibacillus sp.]MDN5777337.1 CHAP domain-containing protein [Humibacillus sp.]
MATAKQFLTTAASQIGTMEGRDPDGNWNNLQKFGKWYGLNGYAWCAMFVSWCANEVGGLGTKVPKYAAVSAGLAWYRARNKSGAWPPQPGDVFMLRHYFGGSWNTAHTGIVERWTPTNAAGTCGKITTIEGNTNTGGSAQGNGVYRLTRSDSKNDQAIIYCRPGWDKEHIIDPTPPKPQICVSHLYKGAKNDPDNDDVIQLNRAVWNALGKEDSAYCKAHAANWAKESEEVYGWETAEAVYALYKVLKRKYPKNSDWASLPSHSHSDWATPGPKLLIALGFKVLPG